MILSQYRNLQTLTTEIYKVVNAGSFEIMKEILKICEENAYSLRRQNTFKYPIVNSVYNGTETVSFWWPKIWKFLLQKLQNWLV